jgi:hypothetical protein
MWFVVHVFDRSHVALFNSFLDSVAGLFGRPTAPSFDCSVASSSGFSATTLFDCWSFDFSTTPPFLYFCRSVIPLFGYLVVRPFHCSTPP